MFGGECRDFLCGECDEIVRMIMRGEDEDSLILRLRWLLGGRGGGGKCGDRLEERSLEYGW